MGRNSGAHVTLSVAHDGTNFIVTWYCQQHAAFRQKSATTINSAENILEPHLETTHGILEQ